MNKKGAFTGLGRVYKFTLSQLYKNKANRTTLIVLALVAFLIIPVLSFFMGGGGDESQAVFYTEVMSMEDFVSRDSIDYDARYSLQYAYSIVVMMICIFSSTYIVRAILDEKSSKLVETLLVSIKSEAMILGKVFAIITFNFSMMASIFVSLGISYFATGFFRDTTFVTTQLNEWGLSSDILNIGPDFIIIVIVSALLACLTLSLISAVSGAGCSNMEDMESANTTATMLILLCYFATVIATPFGSSPAVFMSLCPFISAFAAPAYYAAGDIGFGIMAASWAIQIAVILVIHRLSGRIYDSLIMYSGKRMKMGAILKMALSGKEGK